MSNDPKSSTAPTSAKAKSIVEDIDFASLPGDEIQSDRPLVSWNDVFKLTGKHLLVRGWLLEHVMLNNPKGAKREKDFWDGFIIELSHACYAVDDKEKLIEIKAGREVIVPANFKLIQDLGKYLNAKQMFWVAIQPNGEDKDLGGGQTMKGFDQKVGGLGAEAPRLRVGKYMLTQLPPSDVNGEVGSPSVS